MSSDGKLPSDSGLGLSCGRPDSRALEDHIDADDEDESTVNDEEPGTPVVENVTTPPPHISSPSIPSPMSWGKLDLFTPLGQHLAASLAKSPEKPPVASLRGGQPDSDSDSPGHEVSGGSSDEDELTRGSRDVLVQRLTELAQKISKGEHVPDQAALSLLHGQVDDMDRVVAGERAGHPRRPRPTSLQMDSRGGADQDEPSAWSSPSSSWMRSRYSDLSVSTKRDPAPERAQDVVRKPAVDSFKIASEAEKLNAELETLVTNLKARQEESEHIHELLVTRAERAAQRIIFLQSRVQLLESELQESDADLSHLRLGLKAIEVQCPREVLARDTELAQCIANWKRDYADLKQRRAARRRRAFAEDSSLMETGGRGLMSADSSLYSEATHGDQSSILSTPSRPPQSRGPSYVELKDTSAFETPSPRGNRARRAQVISRLASRDRIPASPPDENDETLTPTSVRSRSTTTPARDDSPWAVAEGSRPSTTSSKALRRIIMSATPPRQPRLVPLTSFGPPLERSDVARAAGQHPFRSYESLR